MTGANDIVYAQQSAVFSDQRTELILFAGIRRRDQNADGSTRHGDKVSQFRVDRDYALILAKIIKIARFKKLIATVYHINCPADG